MHKQYLKDKYNEVEDEDNGEKYGEWDDTEVEVEQEHKEEQEDE